MQQGSLDKALTLFEEGLELAETIYGNEHEYYGTSLNNLALLLQNMVKPLDFLF